MSYVGNKPTDRLISSADLESGFRLPALNLANSALSQGAIINGSITASVGSNALTIALKTQAGTDPSATDPVLVAFRSATLTSGSWVVRSVTSALSLVISSGSTLGTVSATQSRIVALLIDNAGTVELAAVNISGGNDLTETGVITTTAEGGAGAADSASTIYSTTARTSVAYRVVGYVESTQATAGTWATTPSTIQNVGGQALTAMSSLGYGQTWQNVAGSRAINTTYYNTTGKPILVHVQVTSSSGSLTATIDVNGLSAAYAYAVAGGAFGAMTTIVPPGGSYIVPTGPTLGTWRELR